MSNTDGATYRGEAFAVRSVIGGALMGLANLVPGVSGGTMLLAAGVYPQFIRGVAEISTLRFRANTVLMLACVVGAAVVAIAGFARVMGVMLDRHEWAMYALFIGLTLGGVPIIWRMLGKASSRGMADSTVVISSIAGIVLMALLAASQTNGAGGGDGSSLTTGAYAMLLIAGIAGGAAMILPGLSGAYLLLILGQYRTIVDAIGLTTDGLRAGDWAAVGGAMHVFVPVGLGAAVGVVGVSNVVKVLLAKFQRPTLGFLLGLVLGAVIGLWPFREAILPEIGDVIRGMELTTQQMVEEVDPRYYQRELTSPTGWQVLVGLCLVVVGFGISWGISHLGNGVKSAKP